MGHPVPDISVGPSLLAIFLAESDRHIGQMLRHRFGGEWRIAFVSEAAQAARLVRIHRPTVQLLCVRANEIELSSDVIKVLNRRLLRGQSLVALAAEYDQELERAMRVAGATHYLSLDNQADLAGLGQIVCASAVQTRCGPAPPRALANRMILD